MPRGCAPAEVEIDFQKAKEKRKEQGRARELPGLDPRSAVEILAETEEEEEGDDAGEGAGQPCGDEHRRRRAVVKRECVTPLGAACVCDVCVCHVVCVCVSCTCGIYLSECDVSRGCRIWVHVYHIHI